MSATNYIVLPIETDPTDLSVEALQYLMTAMPGWQPHEGNLDVWLIEVFSRLEAETRDVASQVSKEIFRYFGKSLLGIPPVDGAPATATTTWTMRDTAGYTIPAGTLVAYNPSGTSQAFFTVVSAVTVAPGSTSTATGEVLIRAVTPGASGNGLASKRGPAAPMILLRPNLIVVEPGRWAGMVVSLVSPALPLRSGQAAGRG